MAVLALGLCLGPACGAGHPPPGAAAGPTWPPKAPWAAAISAADEALSGLPKPSPAGPPRVETHPADSLYSNRSHGYDASYPQCGAGPPPGADFSVVGVNGGKAFSLNPCFLRQWQSGARPRAIYLNSGYNPDNRGKVLQACDRLAGAAGLEGDARLAYGLGCSTASDSLSALRSAGAAQPLMWWIDVENSNSWDAENLVLNQDSLRGQIEMLASTGKPVGVYSTFKDWRIITGGWTFAGIWANWVAGRNPADACGAPGFSGAPVWLAQERATWGDSGWDSDYAC